MEKDSNHNQEFIVFFDGVNVTKYCVPKLIEIEMISGAFSVGETITGTVKTTKYICRKTIHPVQSSSPKSQRGRI